MCSFFAVAGLCMGRYRAARLPSRHRTQGGRGCGFAAPNHVCRERQRADRRLLARCGIFVWVLFFTAVAVTAHELVDAAGCVDEFLFAGEEGVRSAGDFEFNQGVFFAVDGDSFASCDSGAGDKDLVVRHVFECNLALIFGMDAFFHCYNVII